jgi:hypothetical protein
MLSDLNIYWLLLTVVAVLSVALGIYIRWDNLPESRLATLDSDRLALDLINDESLTEQEREFMKEVAALELTRRHLIC